MATIVSFLKLFKSSLLPNFMLDFTETLGGGGGGEGGGGGYGCNTKIHSYYNRFFTISKMAKLTAILNSSEQHFPP